MAASVQSQPPKPPPPPPKVEAAPKADPKPAAEAKPTAQASAAPKPAQTPDLFEQPSGGGRALPTNGGSSFSPATGAAQNQLRSAVDSTVQNAVGGARSDLQSALGSVNDAARQNGATGFQVDQDPVGFEDISDQQLGAINDGLGDFGGLTGSGPARFDPPSVFLSTGGAAGGVGDRAQTLNLSDTFSRNFGNPGGYGYGGYLDGGGAGSKPGIGGGTDYLNLSGGGGVPSFATTTPQPALSTQTSNDFGRSNPFDFNFGFGNNGHHLGLFNFGSARGGGGGAAGGVADRSGW